MVDSLADIDLEHHNTVVDDVRLHYVAAGPEDGDLVVLLHGFPEFWYSWRYQLPALAEAGYRVVAPDLRGYNRSEKPHGVDSYAIENLVGDVIGLIRVQGRETAHLVGHDWGGAIAWAVGMGRPDALDSLTVMNAPHPAAFAREFDLAQLKRSWYVLFFQVPWLPERLLSAGGARAVGEVFRDQPANPDAFDEEDIRRYREAFARPGAARAAVNYYRAYVDGIGVPMAKATLPGLRRVFDPPGDTEITVPTLVLWGEQDAALGVGISEGLDEWIPDLRVERFPEASHWVQCDVPEAVSEELLAFLD
ncbi:Pimeloyl-ACP methyl ester carboxylesterase [Halorientalis persicus]|uniref:Pimeloyl-ACP methyl ester carboxylesterase n=1 Tax=Halorientalis persicus TaxID=1367881 RepID=A0A1H8PJ09_9EURY|nr:alpha/beta hydrolase [Halorientalis persicus]SEO41553.1 Pimeloyl-ACP methyl ester carboxylesterase [Halorientalis persicus]